MKKIEQVYRDILYNAMERNAFVLTQLELSVRLGVSLSTVNLALKKLERMGAIKITKMNFKVLDVKKILYLWASIHDLEKEIVFKTRVEMPAREIERLLPNVTFAAYSAYKLKFRDVPADYSDVYVYATEDELVQIKRRFLQKEGNPNLFVLKKDSNMDKYGRIPTTAQLFIEFWNLKQWYATDFLKAMEARIK
jgi:DNA-binding Lrp family transcriptional regulator